MADKLDDDEWFARLFARVPDLGDDPAPGWEERALDRWMAASGWNPDRTAVEVARRIDANAEVVLWLWAREEGGDRDLGGEG